MKAGLRKTRFPLLKGPLPRCAACSLRGPQFPNLGKIQPCSGVSRLCFECSAALAGPPQALPCFVSAAGPGTDPVLAAAQWSPAEVPLPPPPAPPHTAGSFSMNPKGVQGPTGRTTQLAAGFSLPGATEGRHAFWPAHGKGCFGHSVTAVSGASLP